MHTRKALIREKLYGSHTGYGRKRETSCMSISKGLAVTMLLRKQKGKQAECPVGEDWQ